jgi:hypothetical protein
METKAIVVLANSVKKKGRCLAGKEVVRISETWEVHEWIRPVADSDGAEISLPLMNRWLGRKARLLEIIEIPFESAVPLPDQPENWLIQRDQSWRSLGDFPWQDIDDLIDSPTALWDNTGNRRLPKDFPRKMEKPASLYLVQPEEFVSIEVWAEPNPFESGKVKRHRQLHLRYGGIVHDLDITDPEFARQYFPNFPAANAPKLKIDLAKPGETLVCASLTPEFRGHHYKLAAAFISPP